ncbi:hypothetical protein BJ138DRAFT_1143895 [Hygrophoropsis aurantiaca]|uniref:Uncharacterized protein n=1 Tax=Hygrophoropsis aurantiaca TaxID=72124 RepID=A0ACB8AN66_9AGAM|nr:hypothetical protein BJ138DRAFT_1143895 [Hygrophoropsis aurantiaca]
MLSAVESFLSSNPSWCFYSQDQWCSSLSDLSVLQMKDCISNLKPVVPRRKADLVSAILEYVTGQVNQFLACPDSDLFRLLHTKPDRKCRFFAVNDAFDITFGDIVMHAIRAPSWACSHSLSGSQEIQEIPWMCENDHLIISRLSKLPVDLLKTSLRRVHPFVRPSVLGSVKSDFARALSFVDPNTVVNLECRLDFLMSMFQSLFGHDVMTVFSRGSLDCHRPFQCKRLRCKREYMPTRCEQDGLS